MFWTNSLLCLCLVTLSTSAYSNKYYQNNELSNSYQELLDDTKMPFSNEQYDQNYNDNADEKAFSENNSFEDNFQKPPSVAAYKMTAGVQISDDGPMFQELQSKPMFVPDAPKECEEFGLCEAVPNYPHQYVENLIAQSGKSTYFNMDILTSDQKERLGYEHSEFLCDSVEKIVFPEAAKNADGKWVFILNKRDEKLQGFKVEVCRNPNKRCNSKVYVEGRNSLVCGQKHVQRAMWSLSEEGSLVHQFISIPLCCSCTIKNSGRNPFY